MAETLTLAELEDHLEKCLQGQERAKRTLKEIQKTAQLANQQLENYQTFEITLRRQIKKKKRDIAITN